MRISHQFLRFCMVGTAGFVVDVAVVYMLAYASGGALDWYAARALSFVAAASTTWILNRNFTFKPLLPTSQWGLLREYGKYMVSMVAGGSVNYAAYVATLYFLKSPYAPLIGVALGSIAGLAVNFLSARLLVFRARAARNA